jgi:hypothetical protein
MEVLFYDQISVRKQEYISWLCAMMRLHRIILSFLMQLALRMVHSNNIVLIFYARITSVHSTWDLY